MWSTARLLGFVLLAGGASGLLGACTPDIVCAPAGKLCTVAGDPGKSGFNGDGPAEDSWLFYPSGLDFDPQGRLVIDDFNNMRIRRIEDDGSLVTVMGNGYHAYAVPGANALDTPMENPVDIRYDPDGRICVAELHAARILTLDDNGLVHVIAGTGDIGFSGDGGPAVDAMISQVASIDIAPDGTMYLADTDNDVIRAIDPDGIITTVAGTPGVGGFEDGIPGAFDGPQRVRLHEGGLLVADTFNDAIRRVDLDTGEVTTLAGTGTPGDTPDGELAEGAPLNEPLGVIGLDDGSLIVAESGAHRVRRIADGVLSTLAGTGEPGTDGDGKDALEAELYYPADVLPDGFGGLYIADMRNSAVRHVGEVLP